jgi:hypothetical protein
MVGWGWACTRTNGVEVTTDPMVNRAAAAPAPPAAAVAAAGAPATAPAGAGIGVGMRERVPTTWTTFAGWTVWRATAGARGAGCGVAATLKFGVGTMIAALPPMLANVGTARGWAAPPPTTGGRAAAGTGLLAAAGDGDAAGFATAGEASFAAGGGGVGAAVQLTRASTVTSMMVSRRRSDPEGTG